MLGAFIHVLLKRVNDYLVHSGMSGTDTKGKTGKNRICSSCLFGLSDGPRLCDQLTGKTE
jgi:hypothetical protein